jgi:hypothetical protein
MQTSVVERMQCEATRNVVFAMKVVKGYMLAGGRAV